MLAVSFLSICLMLSSFLAAAERSAQECMYTCNDLRFEVLTLDLCKLLLAALRVKQPVVRRAS